jgi:teichuronic acid biosynthesis glycosyltransferase TuaC
LPGITDFIISHGKTGFLTRNLTQFVGAIRLLRADPGRQRSMGREGRRFAEQTFDMRTIAASYAKMYADLKGGRSQNPTLHYPALRVQFCSDLKPSDISRIPIHLSAETQPVLQVVIDTESEYDWHAGPGTDEGKVASINELPHFLEDLCKYDVYPALLVDYPVASQFRSKEIIQAAHAAGCEIGVHLHAWSTPPQVEPKDDWHSFSGNLGPGLEFNKIAELTEEIERLIGERPSVFKAGRYGIGPNTITALEQLGFKIDLSACPAYDYSFMGGPNFSTFTSYPSWFGLSRRLLELPTTAGTQGLLWRLAIASNRLTGRRWAKAARIDRMAARLNLLYPRRLSPEGNTLEEMQQLTRRLYEGGHRVFTMSFHSPSLRGGTPYTSSEQDVRDFRWKIEGFLQFFQEELHGKFSTPTRIYEWLLQDTAAIPVTRP